MTYKPAASWLRIFLAVLVGIGFHHMFEAIVVRLLITMWPSLLEVTTDLNTLIGYIVVSIASIKVKFCVKDKDKPKS